jgi:hypothetical protein
MWILQCSAPLLAGVMPMAEIARFWCVYMDLKGIICGTLFSLGYFLQSFQDAPLVVYLADSS